MILLHKQKPVMKKFFFIFSILFSVMMLTFCKSGSDSEKNIVTKRIQYDVVIVNPEPDNDWWIQNIEGSTREKLVKDIITQATEGKVKAYDFLSNKLYTMDEINRKMRKVDTLSIERATPPYDLYDTVRVSEIRLSDIKKLRFLEEWRMNEKTLEFNKKVMGICPMVERLDETGEVRGYLPLFWVFFDDKYPGEFLVK